MLKSFWPIWYQICRHITILFFYALMTLILWLIKLSCGSINFQLIIFSSISHNKIYHDISMLHYPYPKSGLKEKNWITYQKDDTVILYVHMFICINLSGNILWHFPNNATLSAVSLCKIFTILLTLWNSEQKNGQLIKLFFIRF